MERRRCDTSRRRGLTCLPSGKGAGFRSARARQPPRRQHRAGTVRQGAFLSRWHQPVCMSGKGRERSCPGKTAAFRPVAGTD